MKKIKTIFPSRNYITIDTYGDVDVIFNPVGDGTEGEDKLTFRRGRWAFRINDFLSGKTLSNGEQEQMNRKVYTLNLVYDDEDGEPQVTTTYVDPTSVIPLDGSVVVVDDLNKLGTEATLREVKDILSNIEDKLLDVGGDKPKEGVSSETLSGGIEYPIGTFFYMKDGRELILGQRSMLIGNGSPYRILGTSFEYNNGVVQRLNGFEFNTNEFQYLTY